VQAETGGYVSAPDGAGDRAADEAGILLIAADACIGTAGSGMTALAPEADGLRVCANVAGDALESIRAAGRQTGSVLGLAIAARTLLTSHEILVARCNQDLCRE
jgi:hypothetical protein